MGDFGMPTLVENKTLEDNISLCRELGLSFIELNMNFPEYQIAVENTDGFREYEKRAIECMLESDCFVLAWDIGHSKATNEVDVPFILSHRDKLKHFHIRDGTENPPKNHLALGDGEIDLAERLRIARESNARCVLETKTVAALKRSVEWLGKHRG